ncbi:MAG: hypothetical protein IIY06_06985 [Proteobacteria bacterium]|jgi:fructokinase|nr:hypothetical protein [Pseudomonadota bacterium]
MIHYDVFVIGEVLWDLLGTSATPAGAPLNFAHHLQKRSLTPYLVSAVGVDDEGAALRKAIEKEDIPHAISCVGAKTGAAKVIRTNETQTFELTCPAAWDFIHSSDEILEAAASASAIYFGTLAQRNEISQSTIRECVNSFSGKLRILDVNLRPPFDDLEILRWSLRHCDILKFSLEEINAISHALFRSRIDDPQIIVQACIDNFGIKIIIESLGEYGARLWTSDGVYTYAKAPKVNVVSTVGAGDALLASFMAALFNEIPIKTALRMAVSYASEVISQ